MRRFDRARRLGREGRALAALARELDPETVPLPDVQAAICACIGPSPTR